MAAGEGGGGGGGDRRCCHYFPAGSRRRCVNTAYAPRNRRRRVQFQRIGRVRLVAGAT